MQLQLPSEHEPLVCLRPEDLSLERRLFDDKLFEVRLTPGRICDQGNCSSDRCGLSVFDGLLSVEEAWELVEHTQLALERHKKTGHPAPEVDLHISARHAYGSRHLRLLRLLDRLRLLAAQEAGVPGSWVSVASHFISLSDRRAPGKKAKDFFAHCDEGSTSTFHFSAVLWLTGEEDQEGATKGGRVAFWDGQNRTWRREVATKAGRAVVFSSGWENIHQVRPMHGGLRVALTMFMSLSPPSSLKTRMAQKCEDQPEIAGLDTCEKRMVKWFRHLDL